jgi:hypothetical protein
MNFNLLFSILIAGVSLFSSISSKAQNIFDSIHSEKYAYFLYTTHDYDLAAEEYERLIFMSTTKSDSLQWMLSRSYRLSGKPDIALRKMLIAYSDTTFQKDYLSKEYLKILFVKHDYNLARKEIVRLENLDSNDRKFFSISTEFLAGNYAKASQITNASNNLTVEPFKGVISNVNGLKHKSPVLAGTLSGIIPGLGQTYAGNWKDGIFALILTGSSTYQAYRGFHKDGINSAYGWVFSALATAFYSANIYGAVKAANKYNFLNHIKISYQVETLLDNYYN